MNVNYSIVRLPGEPVLFGCNLDAARPTIVRASIFAGQQNQQGSKRLLAKLSGSRNRGFDPTFGKSALAIQVITPTGKRGEVF
jgi:hypothetical protein